MSRIDAETLTFKPHERAAYISLVAQPCARLSQYEYECFPTEVRHPLVFCAVLILADLMQSSASSASAFRVVVDGQQVAMSKVPVRIRVEQAIPALDANATRKAAEQWYRRGIDLTAVRWLALLLR